MSGFEGSFMGDADRLPDGARLECGVCWWVYDPKIGDDVWQIPAGTAFADLPGHWRCPHCDAPQHQFMVCDAGGDAPAARHEAPAVPEGKRRIVERTAAIEAAYRNVENRIRALPVHNGKLEIAVVGLRRCVDGLVGAVATPWCLNLILLADNADAVPATEGSKRMVAFPSGRYEFITGQLGGVGRIESCSLFSPMDEFESMDEVRLVAEEAMRQLFEVPDADEPETETEGPRPAQPSRRNLLSLDLSGRGAKTPDTGAGAGGR